MSALHSNLLQVSKFINLRCEIQPLEKSEEAGDAACDVQLTMPGENGKRHIRLNIQWTWKWFKYFDTTCTNLQTRTTYAKGEDSQKFLSNEHLSLPQGTDFTEPISNRRRKRGLLYFPFLSFHGRLCPLPSCTIRPSFFSVLSVLGQSIGSHRKAPILLSIEREEGYLGSFPQNQMSIWKQYIFWFFSYLIGHDSSSCSQSVAKNCSGRWNNYSLGIRSGSSRHPICHILPCY